MSDGAEHYDILRAILAAPIPTRAKVFAVYLWDRQGSNDAAWPAWRTICRDCGMASETLRRAMAELVDANIIIKEAPDVWVKNQTTHYTINKMRSTWVVRTTGVVRSTRPKRVRSTPIERLRSTRVVHNVSLNDKKNESGGERKQTPETIAAAAWQTVRAANNRPPTFLSFFEDQILGRWNKYVVSPVIVDDWQALYEKHPEDRLSKALAEHATKTERWEPSLKEVGELARKSMTAAEMFAEQEAKDAERRQRYTSTESAIGEAIGPGDDTTWTKDKWDNVMADKDDPAWKLTEGLANKMGQRKYDSTMGEKNTAKRKRELVAGLGDPKTFRGQVSAYGEKL